MFATSVRVSPCSARSSPRSVGRATKSSASFCSTVIRAGICCVSSPSGPFTITRPGRTETETPPGIWIGVLPILLTLSSPNETDDLAADTELLGTPARDDAGGRRHDRHAHPAEDARQAVLVRIHAPAGLGHPPEVRDDPLAVASELELDYEGIEGLALLDPVVLDVALLLEQAGDLLLHTGGGHRRRLVERLVGVLDAGEHVSDWVSQHGRSPPEQIAFSDREERASQGRREPA